MKKLSILLFASFYLLSSCTNEKKYSISSDKYEKGKESLEEIEKKHPEQFLSVSGNKKKNLLQQTVIKGNIFNKAKIVAYKDIEIKLKFFSKTGALLEEDTDVIYESINPGGTTSFKSKHFAPKGTDSIAMNVVSAKF